jgi:hypothetical protein
MRLVKQRPNQPSKLSRHKSKRTMTIARGEFVSLIFTVSAHWCTVFVKEKMEEKQRKKFARH